MSIDARYGMQIQKELWNERSLFKFGFNPIVGTGEETVWDVGGLYSYPNSATAMKVSSSDDADTSTVTISGLDENYDEASEEVTLTGQAAITTTTTFIRVFRAIVTADEPSGDIYIGEGAVASGVPATIYAKISQGENQTLMALWTVPRGRTAYLYGCTVSSGTSQSNKFATAKLKMRPPSQVFQTKAVVTVHNGFIDFDFGVPLRLEPKTDIEFRASTSSGEDAISCTFTAIYETA